MSLPPIELADSALATLAQRGLRVPAYDRRSLRPRIVHIGVGGFHRAHLAVYCDELASAGGEWGICGIGLLPHDRAMADDLAAQDHLYSFTAKRTGQRESRVVGSIIDVVFAADRPDLAIERIASEETAIVSMTVTEAGYDDTPRSRRTFDVVAGGLERRRELGAPGITILSCDNLPGNGDAARRCVLDACRRRGEQLETWARERCTFPSSMVDRITPVTADADRDHLVEAYGVIDRRPVVAEPFLQWVLEDDFAAGRPAFDAVGAIFTDQVHAWERYKLRFLNAGHSALAYLAALAGVTYVDEAMADPDLRHFLERFLRHEAVPTVEEIDGHPRSGYVDAVLERFANTGVRDQIARLCVDGTSKFPTFVMPTVVRNLDLGGPVDDAAVALAGWAHYLATVPEEQQAADALGDRSRPLARQAMDGEPAVFVDGRAGFPAELVASDRFVEAFAAAHRAIATEGVRSAVRRTQS